MTGEHGTDRAQPVDQLREEAALWFARMRGEEAEYHRAAFEQWLARGAVHRAAYNRIGEIFAAGKVLKNSPRSPSIATRWLVGSGIVVLTALTIGWAWRENVVASPGVSGAALVANAQHATPVGRMAVVQLAGGTTAILDTDTLLIGDIDGDAHTIRLDRGRVRLATPARKAGPSLLVGGFRATFSNGLYDLAIGGDGMLDAAVLHGLLLIRPVTHAVGVERRAPLQVGTGQRLHIDRDGVVTFPKDLVDRDWPSRMLEVRSARLIDVLAQANRYSTRKIMLANPALADRRVSGRFRVGDPDRLAARLAVVLMLSIDTTPAGVIILGRPTQENSQRPLR